MELVDEANSDGFQLIRYATVQGRPDTEVTRVLSQWHFTELSDGDADHEVICIESGKRLDGTPQHTSRYKELLEEFVVNWPD